MSDRPTPDDKDWTWILDRPCPECGFDAPAADVAHLGAEIRSMAARWRQILGGGDIVHQRPPSEDGPVWSALEYGAHVRDVFEKFVERLTMLLSDDDPTFLNWDQDATAVEQDYRAQDPSRVAYDLAVNAGRAADIVDRVRTDELGRSGTRSNGSRFTVDSLIRYMVHDPYHHIWDVEQGYEAMAEADSSS